MRPARIGVLFLLLLAVPLSAHAQAVVNDMYANPSPGSGHNYINMLSETVNPANGSVSVRIASPAPKERSLNFPAYVFSYDSSGTYYPIPNFSTTQNPVLLRVAWNGNYQSNNPIGTYTGYSLSANTPNGPATCTYYTDYVFTDPTGGKHSIGLQHILSSSGYGCSYFGVYESPAGGDNHYNATVASNGAKVVDSHGNVYNLFAIQGAEDTNGNVSFTGNQDMAGRAWSFATFGEQYLATSVPGLSAYSSTYETFSPNFSLNATLESQSIAGGCAAPTPFAINTSTESYPLTLAKTLTLPNGQTYQFQYDSVYGLLSKITYPTGATVQYTWGTNPMSEAANWGQPTLNTPNCTYRYDWPAITKRIVSFDGSTPALEQDFAYATQWSAAQTWTSKTTTVTTKDLLRPGSPSFQTIYNYGPVKPPLSSIGHVDYQYDFSGIPAEESIQYKDWNGTLLKTVTKVWAALDLLSAECETLSNGTSGTFYTYENPPTGSPSSFTDQITDKKEYDYGLVSSSCAVPTTTPTRETVTAYKSFPPTSIFPQWSTMLDRPSTIKIYDHGTLVAETDYAYDQTPASPVSPTPFGHDEANYGPTSTSPRGNVTTVTRQCVQGCGTPATTTLTYDETGQALTSLDPCGNTSCSDMTGTNHTTHYSYADNYDSNLYCSPPKLDTCQV